jgi:hypothetical protein
MTNARVQGKVAGAAQRELTLQVGGGTQKIVVADGTPIVRTVPARVPILRPANTCSCRARRPPTAR